MRRLIALDVASESNEQSTGGCAHEHLLLLRKLPWQPADPAPVTAVIMS